MLFWTTNSSASDFSQLYFTQSDHKLPAGGGLYEVTRRTGSPVPTSKQTNSSLTLTIIKN